MIEALDNFTTAIVLDPNYQKDPDPEMRGYETEVQKVLTNKVV